MKSVPGNEEGHATASKGRGALVASAPLAARFQTTRWRVVLGAGQGAEEHLTDLCQSYWYPVYAFIRSQGIKPDDAHDVTQGLFADLLERKDFAKLDPALGQFRCWLRKVAKHYLCNELARARRIKRGGGRQVSIDAMTAEERYKIEPRHEGLAPDQLFDRYWAATLVGRAREQLRARFACRDKAELFDLLEPTLVRDESDVSDDEICAVLGKKPDAIRQERFRMKAEFGQCLRWEVCGTISDPRAIDDELRQLIHMGP